MKKPVIDLVNCCAFCGRALPGTRVTLIGMPDRHWCGWEIKNDSGVHCWYVEDRPDRMCHCTGRKDESCDNNQLTPEEENWIKSRRFMRDDITPDEGPFL